MTDFLDTLRTPEDIAEHISRATGVTMTGRTVWEKARRLGIAKKLGRSMFIAIDDIPLLLAPGPPLGKRASAAYDRLSTEEALKIFRQRSRERKKREAEGQ
ncbi:hypothetical protein DEM27_31230 [Metarhizobium album]|uniref:Uncharacterized protein n=1 Tax=Metarhizobium album TaxID=2182425 RepID=A0A2U2DGQ2_9HYPH|nr:hypothetical protein [Rhizobium album]PWE52421.1 hypothetical protein DEM27_31230 [Rhizobium album]